MNNSKKKLLLMESLLLLTAYCTKSESKEYEYIDPRAYATYQDGHIYIGDQDFLDIIYPNNGDILVLDARNENDPDFRIFDSYLVSDIRKQRAILKVLCDYEKENPSLWNRSIESMESEWFFHNICYFLNIHVTRTRSIDLNNSDEELYCKKYKRK